MFRHKGKTRTHKHNVRLASLLSFIAGIVNVCGFFLVKTLTTNVTGHFAFFAEEMLMKNYLQSAIFLLFILAFLLGAFAATFADELIYPTAPHIAHLPPLFAETVILVIIGVSGNTIIEWQWGAATVSCLLLFAMGMQNSLVTRISKATVRTTHLTGLFTDLGIELSQLFFYRELNKQKKLKQSIGLRLSIIIFFFLGCIFGGFLYHYIQIKALIIAAAFLITASVYDIVRYNYYLARRKLR